MKNKKGKLRQPPELPFLRGKCPTTLTLYHFAVYRVNTKLHESEKFRALHSFFHAFFVRSAACAGRGDVL